MPKTRIKVAVVGLEHWYFSYAIIDALSQSEYAELLSVADTDVSRARNVGERKGAKKFYDDYRQAATDPDAEVVIVTTTTAQHADLTIAALQKGKHVFCNKPMAMNLAECDQMNKEAAKAAGKLLVLNGTWRYWPLSLKAKELVQSGEIGEVLNARFWTRAPLPQEAPLATNPGWFADPSKAPGGAFIDHGIYQFDLAEWMLESQIASVEKPVLLNLKYKDLRVEDYGRALLQMKSGARVTIEEAWINQTFSTGWELTGTKGELLVDTASRPMMSLLTSTNGRRFHFDPDSRDNVLNALDVYFKYLQGGKERPPSGADATRIMGMLLKR
jgi:predicted dehydrogenase